MTPEPGTAWAELKAQLDAWAEHRLPGGALAINREVAKTLVDHNRPAIEAEARAAVLAEVREGVEALTQVEGDGFGTNGGQTDG